jgi:adenylate cyclase
VFELVYRDEGTDRVVPVSRDLVLGRSDECDVVLSAVGISRRHARLVVSEDTCCIRNLASENGTRVNGVSVAETVLADGDHILLGEFPLIFRRRFDHEIVVEADRSPIDDRSVMRRVDGAATGLAGDVAKTNRILRSLSDLARTLLGTQPADVEPRVLDALFEHIPAERGFLMLFDDGGALRPRVVKYRDAGAERGRITISKTIVDRVVKDRVAILTSDAGTDPRFSLADSVRSFGIRSAMCAPLWKGQDVIGIVHVDSADRAGAFTVADLDLLTAFANYAAVAIEQAALSEKVRAEQLARARLEKYFSPRVVTRILSEGELEVREIEATVLFADIVGFSRLSERMAPRDVARLLNDYFSRMVEVIFQHEGTVDKFIGDGIMAVFGAPYEQPDHALRAVRAAMDMRRDLALLNAERRPAPPIEIRVGINSGRVVTGPIGSSTRKEITVLGDTVNVASRITSIARAGVVVVGQRTAELVRDVFILTDLGTVTLRGKDDTLTVHQVIGEDPPR